MPRNHECEAVEKRLAQIRIELSFRNLTAGQRASLMREQASLMNAKWEMLISSSHTPAA
jgi:hypothetical protein